jgi:hypothetical protein
MILIISSSSSKTSSSAINTIVSSNRMFLVEITLCFENTQTLYIFVDSYPTSQPIYAFGSSLSSKSLLRSYIYVLYPNLNI